MHIRPMRRIIPFASVLLILVACGGEPGPEFTPEDMELITEAASMTARNLAFLPDSAGWSPPPDSTAILALEQLALRNVETWPVFFRAAADTASKLEQLMIQAQREEQQFQLL